MATTFFNDLRFNSPTGVYTPREDSYLAANLLTEHELQDKKLLDMGTGCGFLAVIAASNGADVTAVDINPVALDAADNNATNNNVDIDVLESDLFDTVEERYDIICFNAPYIPGSREDRSDEERAWYGGKEGRDVIDSFIDECCSSLAADGELFLVQSSLADIDETLERLETNSFQTSVAAEEKVSWERLIVIHASKV
jgi:release factor glutamine methyltransferase